MKKLFKWFINLTSKNDDTTTKGERGRIVQSKYLIQTLKSKTI